MRRNTVIRAALERTPDCIPEDRFESLDAAGQRHLSSCPRCQAEMALFRQFSENAAGAGEGAAVEWIQAELRRRARAEEPSPRGFLKWLSTASRHWRAVSAVGALALVIAITSIGIRQRESGLTHGPGSGIFRSGAVEAIAPAGPLASAPGELTWRPLAQASRYAVRLTEVDGTLLWQGRTDRTHIRLPESVRARALPGKALLWVVVAEDNRGNRIATSASQKFWVEVKGIPSGE